MIKHNRPRFELIIGGCNDTGRPDSDKPRSLRTASRGRSNTLQALESSLGNLTVGELDLGDSDLNPPDAATEFYMEQFAQLHD